MVYMAYMNILYQILYSFYSYSLIFFIPYMKYVDYKVYTYVNNIRSFFPSHICTNTRLGHNICTRIP